MSMSMRLESPSAIVTVALAACIVLCQCLSVSEAAYNYGNNAVATLPVSTWKGRSGFAGVSVTGAVNPNLPDGIYVVGGFTGAPGSYFNDVWYSSNGVTFTRLSGVMPGPRVYPAIFFFANNIFVVGQSRSLSLSRALALALALARP
jgi:hypothetical protein